MSMNESTNEVRQAAIIETATSDKLEDVSPPLSPEIEPDEIAYRADVGPGGWKVPLSLWKVGESVCLNVKGKVYGPFYIVNCHPPKNRDDKWRYDIKDNTGKTKFNISGSLFG